MNGGKETNVGMQTPDAADTVDQSCFIVGEMRYIIPWRLYMS